MPCINELFSAATMPGMAAAVHDSFRRLLEGVQRASARLPEGLDAATGPGLQRALNVTPQVVNNWKRRGVSKEGALLVQKRLGISATWIETGQGLAEAPGWTGSQHPQEGMDARPVDQDLSQPQRDDEPTTCTWEFIVSAVIPLPKRFRLAMPDDALAPRTPRGTWLHFRTDVAPAFGGGVLVQDSAGARHVRRYAQGPGGRWRAEASQQGYLTLDSADGVQVLAVVVARETNEV